MITYQLLTNLSCNLRCTYCYENLGNEKNNVKDMKDFLLACWKRDQGKDHCYSLDIIGGEPFMVVDDLDELFDFCVTTGPDYGFTCFHAGFSTNGTLLTRDKVRKFLEKWKDNIDLGISIDGTEEKHNKHRLTISGDGSFDDALAGYYVAKEILGKDKLSIKATFTKDSIKDYYNSFVFLFNLQPRLITLNYVFEEKFDEYDGIFMALEIIKCIDYMFTRKPEDWIEISHLYSPTIGFLSTIPLGRQVKPKRMTGNKCGSGVHMKCLGFDRQLYACNRFISMRKDSKAIGYLSEDNEIVNCNSELSEKIATSYKSYPEETCQKCLFNSECSDCLATPFDEDIDQDDYYKEHRQCGFTKARMIAVDYGTRLMKKYNREYNGWMIR